MPRIAGVTIPAAKRIEVALTYVYGIGPAKSKAILAAAKVDPNLRAGTLSEEVLDTIRGLIAVEKTEGDLRREVQAHIKRLRDINSYRGSRHAKRLPSRGQRTKTNARTRRGKKANVGSGRKPAASKT